MQCTVCGCRNFGHSAVLWDELIAEWQLNPAEVDYIDRQQGTYCTECHSSLRSIALADAIRSFAGTDQVLLDWVETRPARALKVLEVNTAGSLTWVLKRLPKHILGEFPDVDMMWMPLKNDSFDLIVHSDTLEHVPDPLQGLKECRRVLTQNGALCFTVPVVVGRLTKNRVGLPPSYHGNSDSLKPDMKVVTEYGADMWTSVIEAGFSSVTVHTVDYPSATALCARQSSFVKKRSLDVTFGKLLRKLKIRKDSSFA